MSTELEALPHGWTATMQDDRVLFERPGGLPSITVDLKRATVTLSVLGDGTHLATLGLGQWDKNICLPGFWEVELEHATDAWAGHILGVIAPKRGQRAVVSACGKGHLRAFAIHGFTRPAPTPSFLDAAAAARRADSEVAYYDLGADLLRELDAFVALVDYQPLRLSLFEIEELLIGGVPELDPPRTLTEAEVLEGYVKTFLEDYFEPHIGLVPAPMLQPFVRGALEALRSRQDRQRPQGDQG